VTAEGSNAGESDRTRLSASAQVHIPIERRTACQTRTSYFNKNRRVP